MIANTILILGGLCLLAAGIARIRPKPFTARLPEGSYCPMEDYIALDRKFREAMQEHAKEYNHTAKLQNSAILNLMEEKGVEEIMVTLRPDLINTYAGMQTLDPNNPDTVSFRIIRHISPK